MADNIFGGEDVEYRIGKYPRLAPVGTEIRVYADEEATQRLTDLETPEGAQIAVLRTNAVSQVPEFALESDDRTFVWVSVDGGRPFMLKSDLYYNQFVPPSGGGTNLKVQQTNPNLTENGVWVETNPDDTVKTIWVETGF